MAFYFALMNVSSVKLEEEIRRTKKLRKKYKGDLEMVELCRSKEERRNVRTGRRQIRTRSSSHEEKLTYRNYTKEESWRTEDKINGTWRVSRPTSMSPVQEVSISESSPTLRSTSSSKKVVLDKSLSSMTNENKNTQHKSGRRRTKERLITFEDAANNLGYDQQDDQKPCTSSQCLANDVKSNQKSVMSPNGKRWKQNVIESREERNSVDKMTKRASRLSLQDRRQEPNNNCIGFLDHRRPRQTSRGTAVTTAENNDGQSRPKEKGETIMKGVKGMIKRVLSFSETRAENQRGVVNKNHNIRMKPKRTQSLSFRLLNKPKVIKVRYETERGLCSVTVSQDDLVSSLQNVHNERLEQGYASSSSMTSSVTSLPTSGRILIGRKHSFLNSFTNRSDSNVWSDIESISSLDTANLLRSASCGGRRRPQSADVTHWSAHAGCMTRTGSNWSLVSVLSYAKSSLTRALSFSFSRT